KHMKSEIQIPYRHILCFSHLRWDFVFQRPQHLLSRFAKDTSVYFFEEPIFDALNGPYLSISKKGSKIHIIVPHLPEETEPFHINEMLTMLLDQFLMDVKVSHFAFWYYTPMAYAFTRKYHPKL